MKQKDFALIIVVAVVSIVIASFASNMLVGSTGGREQQAEVVDPISATFKSPDSRYFNEESVDPTQIIRIGENANESPFEQQSQ